jgi:hypothetical protein
MQDNTSLLSKIAMIGAAATFAVGAYRSTTAVGHTRAPSKVKTEASEIAATRKGDTARYSVEIDPTMSRGYGLSMGNMLVVPAGSICDMSRSTYGPTEWDKPCIPTARRIQVTVKGWLDEAGNARLDLEPALRFVPSADPARWVVLKMKDSRWDQEEPHDMLYCPTVTGTCVDEAETDPTLETTRDGDSYSRRLKHLSAYSIAKRLSR